MQGVAARLDVRVGVERAMVIPRHVVQEDASAVLTVLCVQFRGPKKFDSKSRPINRYCRICLLVSHYEEEQSLQRLTNEYHYPHH